MTVEHQISFDLSARLEQVCALDPEAIALHIGGRRYSWGELSCAAGRLQEVLAGAGVAAPGAPVGVVMRNAASTVAAVLSLIMNRQAVLTLSDLLPGERLAAEIEGLPAVAVVGHPQDWTGAALAAARRAGLLALSVQPDDPGAIEILAPPGLDASERSRRRRPDVALEMLTSGTTGTPKRIPLTYANLATGIAGASHYTSESDDRVRLRRGVAVLAMPLLHMGGAWTTLFNYCNGRPVAMLPRFDVAGWVELIREHRPIVANVPPAALQMLLDQDTPAEDLASLKAVTVGTAPLNPDLADRFEARYGIAVLALYGATEFAGGVAGWTLADRQRYARAKRGSVGRAHGDVELRVIDADSGEPLPFGETGLLEVRAPQLGDGWLRTNDLAELDADGFLWIRGRADDAIIRGGFKISAGHVADILRRHPQIRDAVVLGVPDARLGEIPVAVVESASPGEVDADELREFSRRHLSAYQVPAAVHVVDALPRGGALKVDLAAVRDLVRARDAMSGAASES